MKRSVTHPWGILLILVSACSSYRATQEVRFKDLNLNFDQCGESLLTSMKVSVPRGFKKEKVTEELGCEYRMRYPDEMILYVSSNIHTGSRLNHNNRLAAGIETYSINRSRNDTIRITSRQEDGTYWQEWIMGRYTVGGLSIQDTTILASMVESAEIEQ